MAVCLKCHIPVRTYQLKLNRVFYFSMWIYCYGPPKTVFYMSYHIDFSSEVAVIVRGFRQTSRFYILWMILLYILTITTYPSRSATCSGARASRVWTQWRVCCYLAKTTFTSLTTSRCSRARRSRISTVYRKSEKSIFIIEV